MPAKSQVPARLPAYFPSNSRQFYEERLNSLPKEPPSSPIARGIPFVRRRQLWFVHDSASPPHRSPLNWIPFPSLSLELNLLLSINWHQRCRLHPSGHRPDPSTARFRFDVNFCRRGSPIWPINLLTTRSYSSYRIKALRHSLEGTTWLVKGYSRSTPCLVPKIKIPNFFPAPA